MASSHRGGTHFTPRAPAAMAPAESFSLSTLQAQLPRLWTHLIELNERLAREYLSVFVAPTRNFRLGDPLDLYAEAVDQAVRPAHAMTLLSDTNMRPLVVTRLITESQISVLAVETLMKGFSEVVTPAAAELNNIRILESVTPRSNQQETALTTRKASFFQRMLNARDAYQVFQQALGKVVADGTWLALEALVPESKNQPAYTALVSACQMAIDVLCQTFAHPYKFKITFPSPYRWATYNNKGVPNWRELQFDHIVMTPRNVIRANLDISSLRSNIAVDVNDQQRVRALQGHVVALVITPTVVAYSITVDGVRPLQRVQKSEVVCSHFVPPQYAPPSEYGASR